MHESRNGAPNPRLRVLVVEDEYFIADDLVQATEALGCKVLGPVSDVDAAMRLMTSDASIDIVILDINLRGRQAFDLADLLASRHIPFVFATGYDAAAIPDRFKSIPHWTKPFDHAELAATVRTIAQTRAP